MEVGEEGGEEWGKAVKEASFGGRHVLKAPKFKGIRQVDAEDPKKAKRENLLQIQFKERFFEEGDEAD
jgi:hypothetical protein